MNQNPLLTKSQIYAYWTSGAVQSTAAIFVIGYMIKEEKMTRNIIVNRLINTRGRVIITKHF